MGQNNVGVGLLVTLTAKPGKETELADLLAAALPIVQDEPGTVAWFAFKVDDATYGIVDFFATDEGRQAHLAGRIPATLMDRADDLLASPPDIKPVDVLASKLPG